MTTKPKTSAFGDWFNAQFPPHHNEFSKKTTDELRVMVADGNGAKNELRRRDDRMKMERAALYAWQAAVRLNPECAPPQHDAARKEDK